jgi:hypothetical protein
MFGTAEHGGGALRREFGPRHLRPRNSSAFKIAAVERGGRHNDALVSPNSACTIRRRFERAIDVTLMKLGSDTRHAYVIVIETGVSSVL